MNEWSTFASTLIVISDSASALRVSFLRQNSESDYLIKEIKRDFNWTSTFRGDYDPFNNWINIYRSKWIIMIIMCIGEKICEYRRAVSGKIKYILTF